MPGEPIVIVSGLAWAASNNCCGVRHGESAGTTSTFGLSATRPTACVSRSGW
ncbi:Uncharacterised protein [Bordetella pertussis]|nr:Uncharacterised protein [Bordetella pertussis]CFO33657.1 Uncharacterised protein [Bordetella pertussis]CFT99825.1 Uncharacterised protein [Bordetella pertussis]CPJ10923.1 Uncharacterised protein [Bordetella pertussis]